MERKEKLIKLYTGIGIALVMILCLYIGAQFEQSMRQREEAMQTVTQIAVVNMDTGIEKDGKRLNYAAGLIQFPDTNFTYTSLEAARTGILDGTYAAYIIVPEEFSVCASSIETEPENIYIQYAVNDELREDIYNQIINNIHEFEVLLNANISYMYVSAILNEFHEGQDAAVTIMENDTEEMELISGIDAEKLITELEIAEAEYPENELEYIDLSDETQKNNEYLKNISEYQTESIEKGQEEFQKIKDADTALQISFSAISKTLDTIEITKDEEGNLLYQEGLDKLEQDIAGYKDTLAEEQRVIMTQIGWWDDGTAKGTISGNDVINEEINNSVEKRVDQYNQELKAAKKKVNESLDNVKYDSVSGNMVGIDELKEAVNSLPEFTYSSQDISKDVLEEWQWRMIEAVKAMSVPESEKWHQTFQEEVVDKVLTEAANENKVLKEQRKAAADEMSKYETAIGEYDPFLYMETEQLSEYLTELNENIFKMEEEINESNFEKEEYVSELYSAVLENETAWKENMNVAYSSTVENIEKMVSMLKENKTGMNQLNTKLLLEFSNQLPYTRLGKVEYTEMYDFVSHPLEVEDMSTDNAKVLHNRNYETIIYFIIAVLFLWLVAGGIYHAVSVMKAEKEQDK